MSITLSKQTSVYRQVDAILKTEDIYGGRQVIFSRLQTYVIVHLSIDLGLLSTGGNAKCDVGIVGLCLFTAGDNV